MVVSGNRKRPAGTAGDDGNPLSPSKVRDPSAKAAERDEVAKEELDFEDPFDDEFENEDMVVYDSDDEYDAEGISKTAVMDDVGMGIEKKPVEVWRPGVDEMENDEQLEVDLTAYRMYHQMGMEWPCLSFDILPDSLGPVRGNFPHTMYIVAGTQAETYKRNRVFVTKLSNMGKIKQEVDSDDDDDDSDEEEGDEFAEEPTFDFRSFGHKGFVNRIRCCPQAPRLVATWANTAAGKGMVHIWDIQEHLDRLDTPGTAPSQTPSPKFTNHLHKDEGFALDWNPTQTGRLLSGGNDKRVYLWNTREAGWSIDDVPFAEWEGAVEDVHWKRKGDGVGDVFAAASVDGSIRVFDVRVGRDSVSKILEAHTADVNVLSWSPLTSDLILSGSDDGCAKVWDMRRASTPNSMVAHIKWHRKPITSVDWHPIDSATFALASLDNSVTLWDVSVEPDNDAAPPAAGGAPGMPDQLMFIHSGHANFSEIKWHPQIPGVMITTSEDGFDTFKAENM